MSPLIDVATATRTLLVMVPEWTWLLKHIESNGGYVGFPKLFTQFIRNLKIGSYPKLYEDERLIGLIALLALYSEDEIAELNSMLLAASPEERGQFLEQTLLELEGLGESIHIPKTPLGIKAAEKAFKELSESEQIAATKYWQYTTMALLAGFYQALSIMVHGEKLTSLVARAKSGDDKSFAKAIQIDKQILFAIPYFSERYSRGQLEGDRIFTEMIGAHLHRAPYRGKIRHKSLYLCFAFLEQANLLNELRHREILDICDQIGINMHANRIDDVKNLTKRLAEYRSFQQRQI